ncbi:MAG TPA: hypothetical protein VNX60_09635 [Candidatus Acidoferrum sp.]|jgi:hypothetical protein|nr:hypothetical protein [Candidatus Acidoferrum sp.]
MSKLQTLWTLGMMAFALSGAWAQDSSTPPSTGDAPQSAQQVPVPAYGQDNATTPISENPPLSGLDLPSLEPNAAPLSYLQPGATFSESAMSNVASTLGGGGIGSVTLAMGSLTLKRLWSHYDLALRYLGGVGYYSSTGQGFQSLQQLDFDQKITWKRGQLSLRDSFSYLPEGNFGGSYGSLGSQDVGSLGSTAFGGFWGGSSLGNLGLAPRVLNLSLVDISESLSPRSAITAAAGYAFMHFYGTDVTGTSFIGSSQISAQLGYNRTVTSHTQLALVYGYQGFDFSVLGAAFHSHIIQGLYGHRISGRMDFLVGAGPQLTFTNTQSAVCSQSIVAPYYCQAFGGTLIPTTIHSTKLGVAAQAHLRYKFSKTELDLGYQRFENSGSGLLAGAQSNLVSGSVSRPLSRVWSSFIDGGFSSNSLVQPLSEQQLIQCGTPQTSHTSCPANDATSYNYAFVGGGLHRALGRDFHAYFSYQFNELAFDSSFCNAGSACNRISNRNVVTFGLDWTPRPIRID